MGYGLCILERENCECVCVCACKFICLSDRHTSGVCHCPRRSTSSFVLPHFSKFVADLRFGKGLNSCGKLHVSHCRHISMLYFANLCLLIKGQRALKGKKSLQHTYSDRVSAERWKITRAHLTRSSLCGAELGHFQFSREASTTWLTAYSDSCIYQLFLGFLLQR